MLANMSIKSKVRLSGIICSVLAIAIALTSYSGLGSLNGSLDAVTLNAALLKNHLHADMMHEALRGDVLGALYARTRSQDVSAAIKQATHEHAAEFRAAVLDNKKLLADTEMLARFAKLESESEAYIAQAEALVEQAVTDPEIAAAKYGSFNLKFETLEETMLSFTNLIEAQNKSVQESGSKLAEQASTRVTTMSLLAVFVIAIIALVIPKSINEKLARIQELGATVAAAAAQGNLTVRADARSDDEVGALAKQLNDILAGFQNSMTEIRGAVSKLVSLTGDVAHVSRETSDGVQRQHAETEQVATAVNEMTATVQEIARNSMQTANSANDGNDAATSGRRIVAQAIESMDVLSQQVDRAVGVLQKLKTDSGNIGVVLDVIRSIAEQTNLLALNAAIEAARAGEQGRGFAVVADEVRTLAQRTQQSTREIQDMIQRLQTGVGEVAATMEQGQQQTRATVQKVSEAGTSLDAITNAVGAITDMSTQIATTTEEQSKTTEEINRNVANISGVADQVAASAERAARATQEMLQLTQQLDTLVQRFKLG
jgi:methyl-accepting chemotaxis protein